MMNASLSIFLLGFVVVFGAFLLIAAFWLEKIRRIAVATHLIVNSQRSAMQTSIYLLTARIAQDNPKDEMAQEALTRAKMELDMLDKPRRVSI